MKFKGFQKKGKRLFKKAGVVVMTTAATVLAAMRPALPEYRAASSSPALKS